MKKPSKRVPKTRRLTKAENAKLGYKQSSKKRVAADVKRVTKGTRIYSDREAAQASIFRRTGARQSRETFAKREKTRTLKSGDNLKEQGNLSKRELLAILARNKGKTAIIKARVNNKHGADYSNSKGVSRTWISTVRREVDELIEPGAIEHSLSFSGVKGTPTKFGVVIYPSVR